MKKAILVLMFLMQSQISAATDNTCEKDFGLDVAYCSKAFDTLPSPKLIVDYQKSCIAQAKVDKAACQSGTNICLASCQATYDSSVTTCEQTYNTEVLLCFGHTFCEAVKLAERAACISTATDALNACTIGCGI